MIVAANWKMNPPLNDAARLVQEIVADQVSGVGRILFAPHPFLVPMGVRLQGSAVKLGGQDCHQAVSGAHTGDVSAAMLRECGADLVLLGHSERRADHGETSALVHAKALTALAEGLDVMICVGETMVQRETGAAVDVVIEQLVSSLPGNISGARVTVAYEPVWAIGTGLVATAVEIAEMHAALRAQLDKIQMSETRILYGGSVKPENAQDIFSIEHVDGALVGGASLDAKAFAAICAAAEA